MSFTSALQTSRKIKFIIFILFLVPPFTSASPLSERKNGTAEESNITVQVVNFLYDAVGPQAPNSSSALAMLEVTNFHQCLIQLNRGDFGNVSDNTLGGTDGKGRPVPAQNATGVTYTFCVEHCGGGQEPFNWTIFSQQFGSWLLPWLALLSQLPFGANDNLENLESVLLALGSPALAAYSLVLTVLNGRWIARHFKKYRWPSVTNAVKALSSLQQSPVRIEEDEALLASLIVLPQNDRWWRELVRHLDYTHTWSISAVTSIAWVVIAYIFTVIDSFTNDITIAVNANGQGVGDLWLWLLPIVVGWLLVSPKCDSKKLNLALEKANEFAYVASVQGEPVVASRMPARRGIYLDWDLSDLLRHDEYCTAPIYNYARYLPWIDLVDRISHLLRQASQRAHHHLTVSGEPWEDEDSESSPGAQRKNRTGTRLQVMGYCDDPFHLEFEKPATPIPRHSNTMGRMVLASALALFLQWGTTGAALVVVWFTPTTGLGCRTAAYLLYGVLSTIVWFLLTTSSILTHYINKTTEAGRRLKLQETLVISLRRAGKMIACLNSLWITVHCMFQFSNFYSRCYCNSSVFGRRAKAFYVIAMDDEDKSSMKFAWICGVILASLTATLFVLFVRLFVDPELPEE